MKQGATLIKAFGIEMTLSEVASASHRADHVRLLVDQQLAKRAKMDPKKAADPKEAEALRRMRNA